MNKVSIVILNHNGWAMTHQLLLDIYRYSNNVFLYEVIVVNNGCTEDSSFTGLNWWINAKLLPVRELRLEENLHFIGGFNAGLSAAKGDILIAISNDVRIKEDVVGKTVLALKDAQRLVGMRLLDYDTGWNTFDGNIFPYLEGWFLATTKDCWEALDYFDEYYFPNDMEDIDLSTKALRMGCDLYVISGAEHLGGQTYRFSPEREQITIKNKEKFKKKWMP